MAEGRQLATISYAFEAICAGELPWVALGNFLNEWWECAPHQRMQLVAEPISPVLPSRPELWRWAVFCAASVEWLCASNAIPCPTWVKDTNYHLADPWFDFDSPGSAKPHVRAYLMATTPEPFHRRNIFCGNHMFASKYDFAQRSRVRAD